MEAIEDLGIIDLSRFETKAKNASNLEEAICCYIQYGEFDVELRIVLILIYTILDCNVYIIRIVLNKNSTIGLLPRKETIANGIFIFLK